MFSKIRFALGAMISLISWDEAGIPGPLLAELGPRWLIDRLLQRALRRANDLEPPDIRPIRLARVYSAMAFAAERHGDLSEAIALHEKCISVDPVSVWFHCSQIAELYRKQANYPLAARYMGRAIETVEPDVNPCIHTRDAN